MEQYIYERPREKIRSSGIHSLTSVELLQVIIGSGTKTVPVAQLANRVWSVMNAKNTPITYDELCSVPGIGEATACKVLAALHLNATVQHGHISYSFASATTNLARKTRQSITLCTFSNEQTKVGEYTWLVQHSLATSQLVKQFQTKILVDKAVYVTAEIGYRHQRLSLGTIETQLLAELKQVSKLLSVHLQLVRLVSKKGVKIIWSLKDEI